MRRRIIILTVALIVLGAGGVWWWGRQAAAAESGLLSGSGTIEAETIMITAEVGGRIRSLPVMEGQEVAAGQILAELDTALLEAQLAQARAAVSVAQANLAQLRAGSRPEEVAAASAQVDQARAQRDGAAQAHQDALAMLQSPQGLEAQVAQCQATRDLAARNLALLQAGSRPEDVAAAETSLALAQDTLQATRDRLSAAKTQAESALAQAANALRNAQDAYSRIYWQNRELEKLPGDLPQAARDAEAAALRAVQDAEQSLAQAQLAADTARQAEVSGLEQAQNQVQAAAAARDKLRNGPTSESLEVAKTSLAGAQRALDLALAARNNPQQLRAAAHAAQAQLASAEAQLAQAQARLDLAQAGARPEQIQAAAAQLAQAQAAQSQIEVQIAKARLTAPRAGVVLSRTLHEGEQASAGAAVLTLGSLDSVSLTLYIPETSIGRVRPGQLVRVTVDSFPGRTFSGTVTFIAQEAQFTPRNVQTKDQRATTVFAVRVSLANPDHVLKPGMPADGTVTE